MALLFEKAFGQSSQYWLYLQTAYDLKMVEKVIGHKLDAIHAFAV